MSHRIWLLVAAPVLACAGSQLHSTPATSNPVRYSAEQFYDTTKLVGAAFSADETRLLISTDETGVFNVYSQPVSGEKTTALTASTTESTYAVSYFPKDDRFLYSADEGGNELTHVFVMGNDGKSKDLTPGKRVKAKFAGWSGDKKHFWVTSNERDPKAFDLYRYNTKSYQRKLVFKNTESLQIGAVSRDGKWLALSKVNSNVDSDMYIWNTTKARERPLLVSKAKGSAREAPTTFTPDSRQLLYTTDAHGEFTQLWRYDLAAKSHRVHTKSEWDVVYASFSETGKYRVIATNVDAKTQLEVVDMATDTPVILPALPESNITGVRFSPSETKMAFYLSTDRSAPNLYVWDLATNQHRQLTKSMSPHIDIDQLVDGEVVRYKSFDGLEIPAILYRPKHASAHNKVPALVWVHGGPGGQSRLGYSAAKQHLVNQGYALLAVNNRGSSGYGKTFYHADDRKHGDVDLKDCVWGRQHLESLDWVDGSRVGIIGGSYGGYMVLAALAFEPEAFDVGIDIFGVSNWLRTLKNIPPWWKSFAEYLYAEIGHPTKDAKRLRAFSPLFHAAQIKKPLLVVQGANDPRVPKAESDEIVIAVKKNGVPVEYVLFKDEGHGFRKKANRIAASKAYAKFLEQYLREAAQ